MLSRLFGGLDLMLGILGVSPSLTLFSIRLCLFRQQQSGAPAVIEPVPQRRGHGTWGSRGG